MSFSFRDLTLREVEEELVGAAIDHEAALIDLYGARQITSFRSEQAYELNQIANVLFAWHDKGCYSEERNRDRLEKHFDVHYIHDLWCPLGVIPEYVMALCEALTKSYALHDDAVAARIRLLNEHPFRPESPLPAVRPRPKEPPPPPHRKGGFVGGVHV